MTCAIVLLVPVLTGHAGWPWWWSLLLGLAWAPLCWWSASPENRTADWMRTGSGLMLVLALTVAAALAHALPLGLHDAPDPLLGRVALSGMAALYVWQALIHAQPHRLAAWRRWSYAGFYLDEAFTRLALYRVALTARNLP